MRGGSRRSVTHRTAGPVAAALVLILALAGVSGAAPGAEGLGQRALAARDYTTYLGGSQSDFGFGIAVDAHGSAYVVGNSFSPDFPATPGALATGWDRDLQEGDAFVAKLSPDGSTLEWATYIGGTGTDGVAIAVDAHGSAYVTGQAGSDFPTTPGAFDPTYNGGEGDAFVLKLSPDGSKLEYSTFLGGGDAEGNELAEAIAVDSHGSAYVTGRTPATDFPTTTDAFDTSLSPGGEADDQPDAFVTKLNGAGSRLVYSTYLGGQRDDTGTGIAVDAHGGAHVTGYTTSVDFPASADAFDSSLAVDHQGFGADGFVTNLNPSGSGFVHSTYLGGSGFDLPTSIALGPRSSAFVTGRTGSVDFPTTPRAFASSPDPTCDSRVPDQTFVTKLARGGASLAYSTFLDAPCDYGNGIDVDHLGNAYVSGSFSVRRLNRAGAAVTYKRALRSSYPTRIAVDRAGDAYVTGVAGEISSRIEPPATAGAFDTTHNGAADAFVAKLVTPAGARMGCRHPRHGAVVGRAGEVTRAR